MENIATIKVSLCRHRIETTKCAYCNQFKFSGGDGVIGVINEKLSYMTLNNEKNQKMTPITPNTPLLLQTILNVRSNPDYTVNSGNVISQ